MLESIGVPLDKLKFVRGTTYQLSRYCYCSMAPSSVILSFSHFPTGNTHSMSTECPQLSLRQVCFVATLFQHTNVFASTSN